ncbi:SusC/RagA family TonB-linked outer membrane protein [Echinicola rosea]|nr:TonB-dependent receptor [Echinicola rosea]
MKSINVILIGLALGLTYQDGYALSKTNTPTIESKANEYRDVKTTSFEVTGTVVDEEGLPLPGATVVEKNTSNGTVTDLDGNFSLTVQDDQQVIVVSFVGFESKEIPLNGKSNFNVILSSDTESLEEVVVVGYGSVKKSDLTGSVASVSSEELNKTPISSLDQGLQGRVAGVEITQNSGAPGGATSVKIRGGNSLSTSNEPLYVIDGFPIVAGGSAPGSTTAQNSAGGQLNPLSTINPNDIASIEVLKDASATSIYGARGANGVILITTKKGEKGKTKINYNAYYGVQEVTKKLDMMNAEEFLALNNEINPGALDGITYHDTDWQDVIFRNAPIQNHQLSFAGGSEKTVYNLSFNYFDQQGIIENSDFERISSRLNLENELQDRVKIGINLNYNYVVSNGAITGTTYESENMGTVTAALFAPPIFAPYTDQGDYTYFGDINANFELQANPLAMTQVLNRSTNTRLLSNFYVHVDIAKGLTYRGNIGVDVFHDRKDTYTGTDVPMGRINSGVAGIGNLDQNSLIHESVLNYSKKIGEAHDFNITGVFSTQRYTGVSSLAGGSELSTDLLVNNNLGLVSNRNISSNKNSWRLDSWTARVNYILLDKYLLTLTGRADGSSRFGQNNKWGFFPSAALAWRVKEEDFLMDSELISDLKLRVSYGVTGNANIPLYQSFPRLTSGSNYNFGNELNIGISPTGVANPDIKWERTNQADVGMDVGLWNNQLMLTFDYYHKRTEDLLISRRIPSSSGFNTIFGNFGEIENKGFELGLNAVVIDSQLNWEVSANYSRNRNKILKITGEVDEVIPTGDGGVGAFANGSLLKVGYPVGTFYGYVWDGVWQESDDIANSHMPSAQPGDARYADINGDGAFSAADRQIIGDPNPDFIFGITNNFRYKAFDLSIFVQGNMGNDVFFNRRMQLESAVFGTNQLAEVVNHWSSENPSNEYIRPSQSGRLLQSSRYIEDGSFIRLKNIQLGYTFEVSQIDWLSRLRLYTSLTNLVTWTDYSGYDPELNTTGVNNVTNFGIDRDPYPRAKSYLLGVQVSF